MEAFNYAAQAQDSVAQILKHTISTEKNAAGIVSLEKIHELFNRAKHFQMPINGTILDDNLKGIEHSVDEIRLPYSVITIAFDTFSSLKTKRKIVILAAETAIEEQVAIQMFIFIEYGKVWMPSAGAVEMSANNWKEHYDFKTNCVIKHAAKIPGVNDILKEIGFPSDHVDLFIENAHYATRIVFELVEALSCSNVAHEPINKVSKFMNDKRIRKGKIPINEVHTLIVKVGHEVNTIGGDNTKRGAGVKQHLVRGHIRRYEKFNVWVNSHVRGDATLGVITKNYNLQKAA